MEWILLWIACSVLAAFIASAKGGNTLLAAALGLFLGPIGVLFAFFIGGKLCPACKSRIHKDATRCPRCQETLA
jgi:hypothetical protein